MEIWQDDNGGFEVSFYPENYGNKGFPTTHYIGGSGIEPMTHPNTDNVVSHKQLVDKVGGQYIEYIGFTMWVSLGSNHKVVCTSRALNEIHFVPIKI